MDRYMNVTIITYTSERRRGSGVGGPVSPWSFVGLGFAGLAIACSGVSTTGSPGSVGNSLWVHSLEKVQNDELISTRHSSSPLTTKAQTWRCLASMVNACIS